MLQKMGKAVIFSWDEAQDRIDKWAKNYFGAHVSAGISSLPDYSPEDAFVTVNGFRTEDFENFEALFTNTPDCDLFAEEEFATGDRNYIILPSSVTMSIVKQAFTSPALASINSVYVLNDVGLLVMENSLMDWDELNKPHT